MEEGEPPGLPEKPESDKVPEAQFLEQLLMRQHHAAGRRTQAKAAVLRVPEKRTKKQPGTEQESPPLPSRHRRGK